MVNANADAPLPSGSDQVIIKKSGVKNVAKKKLVAKLSKPVKEAVKKIFEPRACRGLYKTLTSNVWTLSANNKQGIFSLGTGATVDGYGGAFFMPGDMIHAASVMWLGKADSQTRAYNDATNFEPKDFKVTCLNSYAVFTCRNNTQAEYKCRLYTFKPKCYDDYNAYEQWQRVYYTLKDAAVTDGVTTFDYIGETPLRFRELKDRFKIEEQKFMMKPGQTVVRHIQGPKNEVIDFQKHYTLDSAFRKYSPYTRFCIMVVEPQLCYTSTGAPGFYFQNLGAGYGLVHSLQYEIKLAMPEQAGFTYPAAFAGSTQQKLNFRHDRYMYFSYLTGISGNVVDINEDDPTAPITTYHG